ncbi:alpha/beta hydrolase family protein [Acidovorax sp. NCPPB 3576]|uniref:alpha/beta hydrolase family protein n=1 Tax=Acidovorax sp. NCPPB 3576 TaxID=2940488 RepID=UPI00234BD107|nr:dienelactone hydrolase [Acidovorax sp. NCPPB 3576]WCM87860.1 dienelactone hydrolase [Acidovorax sp. NCPPB 3576]
MTSPSAPEPRRGCAARAVAALVAHAASLSRRVVLPLLGLAAGLTQAAGLRMIEVPADAQGPALRGAIWTPCATPPGPVGIGPLTLEAMRNCPVQGAPLPLVIVSHGSGGSAFSHHDTAAALADAGFAVAAISHPGDNAQDLSRQGRLSAFATRPADMRRLTDYLLGAWPGHAELDFGRIGFFGFSRGGTTGLVALGAVPDFTQRPELCPAGSPIPLCTEIRNRSWPAVPAPDPRIRAAVIADPLNFFTPETLQAVKAPVQLWASALGGDGVTPGSVEALRRALPAAPEWHGVPQAGHFAFLAPCSASLAERLPALCRDAPGFDRIAFHAAFHREVIAFLRRQLAPAGAGGPSAR